MPEFPGSLTAYGHAVTDARKSIRGASNDPVAMRQIARAASFVSWLTAQNKGGPQAATGVIGEIGLLWYQDVAQWAGVMEALYEYYDANALSVLAFCATTNFWGSTLAIYNSKVLANVFVPVIGKPMEPLNLASVTADSVEAHAVPAAAFAFRGVALFSGDSGAAQSAATSTFSNARETVTNGVTNAFALSGVFTDDGSGGAALMVYNYGSPADYAFLASRGVRYVRLAFRWERVNRTLGGALDTTEITRLDAAVAAANAVGVQIILDMHNFGNYYLDNGSQGVRHNVNDGTVTFAHFTNVWNLLSQHYSGMAGIYAYQLMNEPYAVSAADLETMQKNAVVAIRANGDTTLCLISGGGGGDYDTVDAGGAGWGSLHATDFMASSDGNRTLTCTLVSGSKTVTLTAGALTAADKNRWVTGANIAAASQITSVNVGAGTFVMSKAAMGSAAGVTVTVRGNYLFIADQYLDFNTSGTYANSYTTEISNAQTAGYLGFGYPLKSIAPTGTFVSQAIATTTNTNVSAGAGGMAWAPSITFIAPPSGAVEMEFSAFIDVVSTTLADFGNLTFNCTAGGGPSPAALVGYVLVTGAGNPTTCPGTIKMPISGLTPGTSYTYRPGFQVNNARATLNVGWGNFYGQQAQFVVRQAAGNGYPGA